MKIGNQGDGGGRPLAVFTKSDTKKYETLAEILNKQQCADYFNISLSCLKKIEKRQPEVYDSYKKGRVKAIESIAKNLIQKAREGNMAAAIFYLKTQAGWSQTQSIDITGDFPTHIVLKGIDTDGSRDTDTE
jgi:hypothetical protein